MPDTIVKLARTWLAAIGVGVLLLLFTPHQATAGIVITGDRGDGLVDANGLAVNLSDPTIRPGNGGNYVLGQAGIFFFALPTIEPDAGITGAELQLAYLGIAQFTITTVPDFNADLFGLGARATATIEPTDYYDGDASLSSDTLIMAGLITPSTPVGTLTVANTSLLDYIKSLYLPDGTPEAAYAVFRVDPSIHLPIYSDPYRGYDLATADNSDSSLWPRLTLDASPVPEPSSAALWLIAISLSAGASWRSRRFADTLPAPGPRSR